MSSSRPFVILRPGTAAQALPQGWGGWLVGSQTGLWRGKAGGHQGQCAFAWVSHLRLPGLSI